MRAQHHAGSSCSAHPSTAGDPQTLVLSAFRASSTAAAFAGSACAHPCLSAPAAKGAGQAGSSRAHRWRTFMREELGGAQVAGHGQVEVVERGDPGGVVGHESHRHRGQEQADVRPRVRGGLSLHCCCRARRPRGCGHRQAPKCVLRRGTRPERAAAARGRSNRHADGPSWRRVQGCNACCGCDQVRRNSATLLD